MTVSNNFIRGMNNAITRNPQKQKLTQDRPLCHSARVFGQDIKPAASGCVPPRVTLKQGFGD